MTAPRDAVRAAVRPMETLLTDVPAVNLTRDGVDWARHGRELPPRVLAGPPEGPRRWCGCCRRTAGWWASPNPRKPRGFCTLP